MFDTHYDILSIAYYSILRNDDSYLNKVVTYLNKDNVSGVIANLYFMNLEEMQAEIGDFSIKSFDVPKIFKMAKDKLDSYNLSIDILYSIEGCDFIKDTCELEELYNLGLDCFLLVWNNQNKYGGGAHYNTHLTEEGKDFLNKAISLGLGIDLSHSSTNTFFDTINVLKEAKNAKKEVVCYASHSNTSSLCDVPRNLTDGQLIELKNVGGKLGLVSYIKFLTDSDDVEIAREEYIKQIKHAVDIMGIDNVMLASDDLGYEVWLASEDDKYMPLYNYENLRSELISHLKNHFSDEDINKIIYKNAKKLYDDIKANKK